MKTCALLLLSSAVILLSSELVVLSFHDRITTNVTWSRDISPIVEARCVRCHNADGPGPMALTTYDEARPWAKAIKEEVLARRMPKWHAVRGYGDFANDPSLSSFEIAMIVAWAEGGAPKGIGAAADAGLKPRAAYAAADRKLRATDAGSRELTLPCRAQSLPAGRLLAVRPQLEPGGSVGIAVRRPDGRRDIVALIGDFEPDFAETYWLRTPLSLSRGSRLETKSSGPCEVTITLAPQR
jgi:hypothetical protein